jgi:ABC-type sugar transport system substrate-binding protein
VLQAAKKAGILVMSDGTPMPSTLTPYVGGQIIPNLCASWKDGIDTVAKELGSGPKTYAILTGPQGNSYAGSWQPCAEQYAAAAGWTKAYTGFTEWTPQGAKQATSAMIASGKKIDVILYDATMEYMIQTYNEAHVAPPPMVNVGANDNAEWPALQQSKAEGFNPQLYGVQSQAWLIRAAVTAGIDKLAGETVPAVIPCPLPVVDASQVASLIPKNGANTPAFSLLSQPDQAAALAAN